LLVDAFLWPLSLLLAFLLAEIPVSACATATFCRALLFFRRSPKDFPGSQLFRSADAIVRQKVNFIKKSGTQYDQSENFMKPLVLLSLRPL
jgi:hypothetical protein